MIELEWVSSSKIDRIVDSIGFLIMELEEQKIKEGIMNDIDYTESTKARMVERYEIMKKIVGNRYEEVSFDDEAMVIVIRLAESSDAKVNCGTMEVETDSKELKDTLSLILQHVEDSLTPIKLD